MTLKQLPSSQCPSMSSRSTVYCFLLSLHAFFSYSWRCTRAEKWLRTFGYSNSTPIVQGTSWQNCTHMLGWVYQHRHV
jgi:hypothetical protein